MAEKVELVQLPESLVCSLCIEPFKTPTLLSCGHTFCKVCLELYDKKNRDQNFMECPLCKEHTQLGENRISGLPPNFSVNGIEEELHVNLKVNGKSSEYCSLHSQVYKDILCKDCNEFICLTCLLETHPSHWVKKKEVVVAELNKKRSSLIKRSDKKKARIEVFIKRGKKHRLGMHSHLENLDREIENSFLEKSEILMGHKERLTKEVDEIRKQSGEVMTDLIGRQKHSLQKITSKNIILKSGLMVQEGVASTSTCKFRDSDALKTRYMEVLVLEKELDRELDRDLNDLSTADALQEVEDTRFRPSDENDLDLGTLGQDASESENDSDQGSVDQDASESESEDVLDENVLEN